MATASDVNAERQRSNSLSSTTALTHQLSLSAFPDELARRLDLVDQVTSYQTRHCVTKLQLPRVRHATCRAPTVCIQGCIACSDSMTDARTGQYPHVALVLLRSRSVSLSKGCSLYKLASSRRCVQLVQQDIASTHVMYCSKVTIARSRTNF